MLLKNVVAKVGEDCEEAEEISFKILFKIDSSKTEFFFLTKCSLNTRVTIH